MPFLALLNGMPGKVIATVIGSMALVAALLLWLNAHDNRVLSAQAGRDAALVAAAQQTQAANGVAAVVADAAAQIAAAARKAHTEKDIDHARDANVAADSDAIRRAFDALRASAGSGAGQAPDPGQPADLRRTPRATAGPD